MNILFFLSPKMGLEYLHDTDTAYDALKKIKVRGYTAIPIVSKTDGTYIGTVSEGDILWNIVNSDYHDVKLLDGIMVEEIINKDKYKPVKVSEDMEDLIKLIMNQNFVPVVDDRGVFMGIVTRKRVIDYLYNETINSSQKI